MKITVNGVEKEYDVDVKLLDLAKEHQAEYEDDILLAIVNGQLRELTKVVSDDATVEFITGKSQRGRRAYRRSLIFLMQRALMDIVEPRVGLHVEHTLGQGYFCTVTDREPLSEHELSLLKKTMKELVEKDIPIKKYSVRTSDARKMFEKAAMDEKQQLLRYRTSSNINIYDLDGCKDYFYGYMVPSTGYLKYFDIKKFEHGFMVLMPGSQTRQVADFSSPVKLFHIQQDSSRWAKGLGVQTVGQLNEAIAKGKAFDLIFSQEAFMERRIGELAEKIAQDKDKKFIMIAGPSSSGKTTFSHRLSSQLRALGVTPHPLPLDDYYLNRDQMPLDEFGNKDFESIEGMDIAQFNEDMGKLLAGQRVLLPEFNFVTGKREYKNKYMQLGKDDILVIEGIHGLNDRMSSSLPTESKFKIYISALTQLTIDEHNPLSTADGRLIRRIVRDARTRGTNAADTIAMWDSVRRGEEKNIFPFQEQADAMFNSALIYEMAVLKLYALPLLYSVDENNPNYVEAKRLIKLLDYFLTMPADNIPNNSLVREFIGGSALKV